MKYLFLLLFFVASLWGESLPSLIVYAKKHSTISKQNQSMLDLAALNQQNAKAQLFGELNVVGDYTHYNIERTLAPLVPSTIASGVPVTTSKDIYTAGLKYSVPLFTGFAQTAQVEIEGIAKQMSQAKYRLSSEQLIYNIRSLYLTVLAQKEMLHAQQRYTRALQKLQKQIAYEVKLGKKAKIDALKASADVAANQSKEALFLANIATTKATLAALVGKPISSVSSLHIVVKKPHYSVERLYRKAQALAKVKVEALSVQKAQKMIDKSKASSLPQVNFSGYVGKNYGQDVATNDWNNEALWQVGVNVSYNLVDFGKRSIATQKAKIAKMQAGFQKEQTLLDLKKLLTQGVAKVKQYYASYRANKAQYGLAKEAQKIEQVRYNNSASTLNDLLLAQAKTWLAQAQMIESKYNYQKSKYTIAYLMEEGAK
jgi:outer membrane protein TolC